MVLKPRLTKGKEKMGKNKLKQKKAQNIIEMKRSIFRTPNELSFWALECFEWDNNVGG